MKEAIKQVLIKLGYTYPCKKCGNREFQFKRFAGDMIMFALLLSAFYIYFTDERPMIDEMRNNSANCYYEEVKNLKTLGSLNVTDEIVDIIPR